MKYRDDVEAAMYDPYDPYDSGTRCFLGLEMFVTQIVSLLLLPAERILYSDIFYAIMISQITSFVDMSARFSSAYTQPRSGFSV